MRNLILTFGLLSTLAGTAAAQIPVIPAVIVQVQKDGSTLDFAQLYTDAAWQTICVDGNSIGLTENGPMDGRVLLTSDASDGLTMTMRNPSMHGGTLDLAITAKRADRGVAMNRMVTFTLTNVATGQRATFTLPVFGTAE